MSEAYLREATYQDIELLFTWANDPEVRRNSFNPDPISYDGHKRWFENMMNDPEVLQFIIMDEEKPVGQIRLNINGDEAEISYSVVSDCRGKGYGRKMLQLITAEVKKRHPEIKAFVAKVKPGNAASRGLFESEGYEMKYTCYSLDTM